MATPSPSLQQRVCRFLSEDASTFAFTSSLCAAAYTAIEFRGVSSAAEPSAARRLQLAARKTLPVLPAIALSAAVGIVGIKLTMAAVQDARRDYSRTSVLISVPLFAAIVHAPGGPRLMAKSAVGYGAFILAADAAASKWHHYHAALQEEPELAQLHHHHPHELHHLHDSDIFIRQGFVPNAAAPLIGRLGEN